MGDPNRGNTTIHDTDGTILATVYDNGGTCIIDSTTGLLTPDQAFEYGAAVLRWACQRRRQEQARRAGAGGGSDG